MALGESIGLPMGKATREAFGETLRALGHEDPKIVVLDGDLNNSNRTDLFAHEFPNRFFNIGIAESNLAGMAGGLAACGKHPWIASFAAFLLCNAFDQIRMSIAFPQLNVKVIGSHGGISIGEDGPSQMGIEDVALACALPHFTVMVPADEVSTEQAIRAASRLDGPVYIRTGRPKVPIVYRDGLSFQIGKAIRVRDGGDVTLIANGLMVALALEAAAELEKRGIAARVLDMTTVKPLDEAAVAAAAAETKGIVVAEEHLGHGGLGAAVATCVGQRHPAPMRFVNLDDTYAESGKPDALLEKYGLTYTHIERAAFDLTQR
jgi:transketolase